LKNIVDAVHAEGSKLFMQLHHAGVVGISEMPMCPSEYSYPLPNGTIRTGKEMTVDEIRKIQNDFIEAGVRAYQVGYDGIELHGCHQYLISQFLNGKVNRRDDIYGKFPELFAVEIVKKIKERTSPDFIVGIRLGGFEPTLDDAVRNAVALVRGGIDFIDVSYGFIREQETFVPEESPFIDIIHAAEKIKKAVPIPVFAANRITSPELAEAILIQTGVDLVGIGRGFSINPNWMKDAIDEKDTGKCLQCKMCRLYDDPDKCPGKVLFRRK